jgi:hypothetical protein
VKRSKLILIILVALTGFAVYTYLSRSSYSTVEDPSRDFGFRDTAAITKIFIADKEGNSSTLLREKSGWRVNDKYSCRSEAILNLLEVIRNVEVKMSVPKGARDNVIKFMSFNAVKIEIYAGKKLVKQYYVGHETPDGEATYMILTDLRTGKNFKDPYVCFIPGFNGYLQPRYIASENAWRDRLVLNYIPPEINQISVNHIKVASDSSFNIQLINSGTFKLSNGRGEELEFDEEKMKQYLVYFQNISYEGLITGKDKHLQDSLTASKPFCEITVTRKDNKTDLFKFYRKPYRGDINPEIGVTYTFDPDRLYMSFDNDKEWAIIQYFVFGKLLVNSSYFSAGETVKK